MLPITHRLSPSSQGFLSPPWARTWDHELRYPFERARGRAEQAAAGARGALQAGRRRGARGKRGAGAGRARGARQAGRRRWARAGHAAGARPGRWARGRALGTRQAGAGRAGRSRPGRLGWPCAVHSVQSAHFRSVLTRFFS